MRLTWLTPRCLLLGCAVLGGALLAHILVAMLAQTGLFASQYGVYHHETIVPLSLCALLLGGMAALAIGGHSAARAAGIKVDWLADAATHISRSSSASMLAKVYVAQLGIICTMESIEQIIAFGHPLGLAAALGAPLPIALGIHLLTSLGIVSLLALAMRAIVAAGLAVGRALAPLVQRLLRSQEWIVLSHRSLGLHDPTSRQRSPLARRISSRPPPFTSPA